MATNWIPTRKWAASIVGGFTPIALSAIDSGWDKTESKMTIVLASGAVLAYLIPNTGGDAVPSKPVDPAPVTADLGDPGKP